MAIERMWEDAIHFKPDSFRSFWSERLRHKRDILLILGLGWDPRMNALPRVLNTLGFEGLRHMHLIDFKPSPSFESPIKVLFKRILKNWIQ